MKRVGRRKIARRVLSPEQKIAVDKYTAEICKFIRSQPKKKRVAAVTLVNSLEILFDGTRHKRAIKKLRALVNCRDADLERLIRNYLKFQYLGRCGFNPACSICNGLHGGRL